MQIRYLNPLSVFLASTLLLYFIPSLFIREFAIDVYNTEYPGYVIDLYVKNNLVSFIAILLAIISHGLLGAKIFLLPLGKKTIAEDFPYLAFNRFIFITSWLAILFSVPYLLLYALSLIHI